MPSSDNYTKGKMYYTRVNNRGFFHQWWKTIQSGFKSIMLPDSLLNDNLK